MKYVKKIPPTNKHLRTSLVNEGWEKIKEPSNLFSAISISIPFMIFGGLFSYFIVAQFNTLFMNSLKDLIYTGSFSVTIKLEYILLAYLLVWLHELIHAVLIPNFMKSENTYFGIRPWGGFVYTTEKLGKSRFLFISIAPYIILSVILPVILGVLGLLSEIVVFLILLNAIASSVDILNSFLILVQVPNGSMIVNNGFETYYKKIV